MSRNPFSRAKPVSFLLIGPFLALSVLTAQAQSLDPAVRAAEKQRIEVIQKVTPTVVAVLDYGGQGGGSGVIIDPAGYALTNFHVTAGMGPVMRAGLADGIAYDAVLVGLDRVGDVALIKLMPKKEGTPFPYAKMANSEGVRVGDWSLAMGNPFLLASDFTPTVTFGLISGINRYQPPDGGSFLEYTDCIQFDTSINAGNSGGPLFNMNGELIGINGRGSFEFGRRGKVNVGVGYAITTNQIKNFLRHLYAGIDTDHATLGALVQSATDEGVISQLTIKQILEESDAYRRGLRLDDALVSFAGRPLTSTNQYKNVLGIYPKDWRVPLVYRRDNVRKEVLVRLMGHMDQQPEQPMPQPRRPGPNQPTPGQDAAKKSPAMKFFKEKKGFANYYFNELETDKLWTAFRTQYGDFSKLTGAWMASGKFDANERKGPLSLLIAENAEGSTDARLGLSVDYVIKGLPAGSARDFQVPEGSGGLLTALYHYRRLLIMGARGFEGEFSHGGLEPFYPQPPDGKPVVEGWGQLRVDCDVLRTKHGSVECKWYFDRKEDKLLGCEAFVLPDEDPCELTFSDYKPIEGGRRMPHRIDVRFGDKRYGHLAVTSFVLK